MEFAAQSPADNLKGAPRPSAARTARSAVTNGSQLLGGVDMRSATARRFRDLVTELAREHGGELSVVELGLIRSAAALTVKAEELQAGIVRGDAVDVDELVRLSSEARRVLQSLRKRAPAAATSTESFADIAMRAQSEASERRAKELAEDEASDATAAGGHIDGAVGPPDSPDANERTSDRGMKPQGYAK
jgi:hypothetical protein